MRISRSESFVPAPIGAGWKRAPIRPAIKSIGCLCREFRPDHEGVALRPCRPVCASASRLSAAFSGRCDEYLNSRRAVSVLILRRSMTANGEARLRAWAGRESPPKGITSGPYPHAARSSCRVHVSAFFLKFNSHRPKAHEQMGAPSARACVPATRVDFRWSENSPP
jgi:hypothetical protein